MGFEEEHSYQFELEERTFQFAESARKFYKKLRKTVANIEDGKLFIRTTGLVGIHYIDAAEAQNRKDFSVKIQMCRRSAKESLYWLRLLDVEESEAFESERLDLIQEAEELTNIFGSIVRKSEG